MTSFNEWYGYAFALAFVSLRGWLFMLLWNVIVPAFGGPQIDLWHGIGISCLLLAVYTAIHAKTK